MEILARREIERRGKIFEEVQRFGLL